MSDLFVNARFTVQALTGVQRFASEILRALPAAFPDRRVVALAPAGPMGAMAGHGWEQLVLPWRARGGVLINLGNTAPLLARRQVVVIHDAGVFATPEAYSPRFRLWYRFLQRCLARGRATLVSVSAFARAEVARVFGIDPARICLVSEGAEHLQRVAADGSVLIRNGLTARNYVLAVGSLAAHKNLAALGPTAAMLAARGMELVVTGGFVAHVFGGTEQSPPPGCRFVGRVSDGGALRALYAGAACFVFPSRYEGFGLPAVEAMAEGCPVVAARAGALPEICGTAATYCDPASEGDIARAVQALLDAPAEAARLRIAGLAQAASFTWPRAAALLREAILRCEAGR